MDREPAGLDLEEMVIRFFNYFSSRTTGIRNHLCYTLRRDGLVIRWEGVNICILFRAFSYNTMPKKDINIAHALFMSTSLSCGALDDKHVYETDFDSYEFANN